MGRPILHPIHFLHYSFCLSSSLKLVFVFGSFKLPHYISHATWVIRWMDTSFNNVIEYYVTTSARMLDAP